MGGNGSASVIQYEISGRADGGTLNFGPDHVHADHSDKISENLSRRVPCGPGHRHYIFPRCLGFYHVSGKDIRTFIDHRSMVVTLSHRASGAYKSRVAVSSSLGIRKEHIVIVRIPQILMRMKPVYHTALVSALNSIGLGVYPQVVLIGINPLENLAGTSVHNVDRQLQIGVLYLPLHDFRYDHKKKSHHRKCNAQNHDTKTRRNAHPFLKTFDHRIYAPMSAIFAGYFIYKL